MSARRHRGTPSIVLSALLGCRRVRVCSRPCSRCLAAAASSHDGACAGDTGVTVVVDATNVGCRHTRQLRARRAGERMGSAEERGSHRRADPDRGRRGVPDRRLPVRGLSHVLGDELLELPPRTERAARVRRGRSARRARRRTSPRPGSVEGWKYTSTVDPEGSARHRTGVRGGRAADDTAADRTTGVDARRRHLPGEARSRARGHRPRPVPSVPAPTGTTGGAPTTVAGAPADGTTTSRAEHGDRRRGQFDDDRTRIDPVPTARTGARSAAST